MLRSKASWALSRPGGRWRSLPAPFSPALVSLYAPTIVKFKFRRHGALSRYLVLATGVGNTTLVAVSTDLINWETAVLSDFEGKDIAFSQLSGSFATIHLIGVGSLGPSYTTLTEPGLVPSLSPPTALSYSPTVLEFIPSSAALVAGGASGWNFIAPTTVWTAVANGSNYGTAVKSLVTATDQFVRLHLTADSGLPGARRAHHIVTQGTAPSSPRSTWIQNLNFFSERTSVSLATSHTGPGISVSPGGAVIALAQTSLPIGPPSPFDSLLVTVEFRTIYGAQLQPIIDVFDTANSAAFPYSNDKIADFAVHPTTGNLYLAFQSGKIYTSSDYGVSWTLMPLQFSTSSLINSIFIEPGDKGVTMMNASGQIFTSP